MSRSAGQILLNRSNSLFTKKLPQPPDPRHGQSLCRTKEQVLFLHREVLRSASDFFRCRFMKSQSPGADPEEDCTLADVNPASFELFITWLYQRTVATIPRRQVARDSAGHVLLDSDSEDDKQQLEDNNGPSGPYYALLPVEEVVHSAVEKLGHGSDSRL